MGYGRRESGLKPASRGELRPQLLEGVPALVEVGLPRKRAVKNHARALEQGPEDWEESRGEGTVKDAWLSIFL